MPEDIDEVEGDAGAPRAPPAEPGAARLRRVRGALVRGRRVRRSGGARPGGRPGGPRQLRDHGRGGPRHLRGGARRGRAAGWTPRPPPGTGRDCGRSGWQGSATAMPGARAPSFTRSPRTCTRSATTGARSGRAPGAARSSAGSRTTTSSAATARDRHISTSNPLIGEPRDFVNDDIEFRQFSCPGCGTLIENEVAVASDPVLRDIDLRAAAREVCASAESDAAEEVPVNGD